MAGNKPLWCTTHLHRKPVQLSQGAPKDHRLVSKPGLGAPKELQRIIGWSPKDPSLGAPKDPSLGAPKEPQRIIGWSLNPASSFAYYVLQPWLLQMTDRCQSQVLERT